MATDLAMYCAAIEAVSPSFWNAGLRVLQGARFAESDDAHIAVLLEYMNPPSDAVIADIGCGFGEVARIMTAQRPDLNFVLINSSASQLARAPGNFRIFKCDMHNIPVQSASVDGAMFCYSLCHGDIGPALIEAARITKPGGFLFVYDYVRANGDNALTEAHLFARFYKFAEILTESRLTGWELTMFACPPANDALFRDAMGDSALYDAIFDDLTPAVWKMVKRDG